jgi:hypothetical protein
VQKLGEGGTTKDALPAQQRGDSERPHEQTTPAVP